MADDDALIPDERLRLIFVCCHPTVAPEARAALTLRLVCGLSTAEIARAFLVSEPALAQRLVFGGVVMSEDPCAHDGSFQRSTFRHAASEKQEMEFPNN